MLVTRGYGPWPASYVAGVEVEISVADELLIEFDLDDSGGASGMNCSFKQGEGKVLAFKITKGGVDFEDLSTISFESTFVVKKGKRDLEPLISKGKDDYEIDGNLIKIKITNGETKNLEPGTYVGELTIALHPWETIKSVDLMIEIDRAVSV